MLRLPCIFVVGSGCSCDAGTAHAYDSNGAGTASTVATFSASELYVTAAVVSLCEYGSCESFALNYGVFFLGKARPAGLRVSAAPP